MCLLSAWQRASLASLAGCGPPDDAGRASAVATKKSDDTAILSLSYTRDNVGNPTSVSEALLDTDDQTTHNATLTYTYDDLHRLTSEKRSTYQPIWYEYTMDAAGNRTQFVEKDGNGDVVGTTNATYSDDNRLLTYGNLDYDWDDNGNLTSKTVNQVETTYGWDYENKMTSLTDGSTLSFTYNGDGLRQSRTVDGTTTRFVYSGMRLLQETNSGGTTQATYTLAPMGGQWEPLVAHQKSGASRFYAFDALGTTRALTDGSEDVAAVFTDDAWGNVLNASDSTATVHQYVGRYGYYLDGASGLQLLTQRYYDTAVGRFVSEDPQRWKDRWFEYGLGAPTLVRDPSGLWPWSPSFVECDSPCRVGQDATCCLEVMATWDQLGFSSREQCAWECATFLATVLGSGGVAAGICSQAPINPAAAAACAVIGAGLGGAAVGYPIGCWIQCGMESCTEVSGPVERWEPVPWWDPRGWFRDCQRRYWECPATRYPSRQ